jgi:CBS domain-containing protein
MPMKVQEIMVREVGACGPSSSLAEAARIMWERDCGFVPVIERDTQKVCGVVTDRDACMAAFTQGLALGQIPVERAMATLVYTCRPQDDLDAVDALMSTYQVRRLPVTDDEGRLVGVVSLNDLAVKCAKAERSEAATLKPRIAETLSAISRHRNEPGKREAAPEAARSEPGRSEAARSEAARSEAVRPEAVRPEGVQAAGPPPAVSPAQRAGRSRRAPFSSSSDQSASSSDQSASSSDQSASSSDQSASSSASTLP